MLVGYCVVWRERIFSFYRNRMEPMDWFFERTVFPALQKIRWNFFFQRPLPHLYALRYHHFDGLTWRL